MTADTTTTAPATWPEALAILEQHKLLMVGTLIAGGAKSARETAELRAAARADSLEEYEEASRQRSADDLATGIIQGEIKVDDPRLRGFSAPVQSLRAAALDAARLHPRPRGVVENPQFVRDVRVFDRRAWLFEAPAGFFLAVPFDGRREARLYSTDDSGVHTTGTCHAYTWGRDDTKVTKEQVARVLQGCVFRTVLYFEYGVRE